MKSEELQQKVIDILERSTNFNAFISELKAQKVSVWLAHNEANKELLGISYRDGKTIVKGKENDLIGLKQFYQQFDKDELLTANITPEFLLNTVESRKELDFSKDRSTIEIPQQPMELPEDFKLPNTIYGIELTDAHKEQLMSGKWSDVIGGLQIDDVDLSAGRLKLQKNELDEYVVVFRLREMELVIPKTLETGKDLTDIEIAELTAGRVIGPFKDKGNDYYVQMDKELNRITLSKPSAFNLENKEASLKELLSKELKLHDYVLTDQDKNNLVNGKGIGTKVFLTKDGYVKSNISIETKRGHLLMHFDKSEPLAKEQALEFIAKQEQRESLNLSTNELPLSNDSSLDQENEVNELDQSNDATEPSDLGVELAKEKEFVSAEDLVKSNEMEVFNKKVIEAVQREDYKSLKGLVESGAKKGLKPSSKLIESISSSSQLSRTNKIASLILLGDKDPSQRIQEKKKAEKKEDRQTEVNANLSKGKDGKKVKEKADKLKRKLDSGVNKVKGLISDIG
jgi:hypothetical protein